MKSLSHILAPYTQTLEVLKRFIKEFWWPLVIALVWTWWGWKKAVGHYDPLEKGIVNFFAAGWAFGQWNRIKKQKRTEDGLASIGTSVTQLISTLEASTNRMIGFSTGGNSFCEFMPTPTTLIFGTHFGLMHHGDFPLYDVKVRIVDIERMESIGHVASDENIFEFDVLIPNHITTLSIKSAIRPSKNTPCHLNIFVTARNGSSVQMFQGILVNGLLRTASNIERAGKIIFEDAAVDFPKGTDGTIDWSKNCLNPRLKVERDLS